MSTLRIATRESPLALWQAEHVRARLTAAHPRLVVQLLPMSTQGDRLPASLAAAGGKGLFVKELEQSLLDMRADLAVHSMKDVPAQQPEGLCLTAFLEGEDPRDAFVSNRYEGLFALPRQAHVGTASLRRQSQLRALRPDLRVSVLRGNVGTRLRRLDEDEYDAILLAAAGLMRLGLGARIRERFDVEQFIPAIGQGVIGVECRADDARTRELLAVLHDPLTATRLAAERALSARLGGACQVPVAGHARLIGQELVLQALVASPDGAQLLRGQRRGPPAQAAQLGAALAEELLGRGGREILQSLGVLH